MRIVHTHTHTTSLNTLSVGYNELMKKPFDGWHFFVAQKPPPSNLLDILFLFYALCVG